VLLYSDRIAMVNNSLANPAIDFNVTTSENVIPINYYSKGYKSESDPANHIINTVYDSNHNMLTAGCYNSNFSTGFYNIHGYLNIKNSTELEQTITLYLKKENDPNALATSMHVIPVSSNSSSYTCLFKFIVNIKDENTKYYLSVKRNNAEGEVKILNQNSVIAYERLT